MTNELYVGSASGTGGNYSKAITGLESGMTYYYRAYVIVGTTYFYGTVKSFTTTGATTGDGSDTAYASSWLGGYGIPATGVSVSTSDMKYNGRYCHSTVSELYGSTKACIYNTPNSRQRVVAHTFSYNGKIQSTYTMLFDADKRCALWSAYTMHATDYADKNVGRNDSWNYDPALPTSWQPDLSSSYGGNYSRGHQVSSNDRQTTREENKQTFYYSNMTPQVQTLNGGTWNVLENKIQALGKNITGRDTLYVVTGPVFESGYKTTKDDSGNVCAVPTKYFKCIMKCTFNATGVMTDAKGAGYLFEHNGTNAPRKDVTIDYIENLTGFDFFANVPDNLETAAERTSYSFF